MHEELLELERRFREASSARDGDFYRTHLIDDALYVFPGTAGPWTREECAKAVEENDAPWAWFEIQQPRIVEVADGASCSPTSRIQAQLRPDCGGRLG